MKLAIGLLMTASLWAGRDLPEWVTEAARQPVRSVYGPKVTAVMLLAEEQLTVAPDGKRVMRERGAIKIIQTSRSTLVASRTYYTKSGRIRDFRAWLIPPSGKEVEYGKNRIIDRSLGDGDSYDDGREKAIMCDVNPPVGSVFAYEVTEEEDTIFTTYHYSFQEREPVLTSRFILSLPAGWEAHGYLFNHADIAPRMSGNTYTWEVQDLPAIEPEEYGPGHHAVAPRLGITYFPAGSTQAALQPLKDWPAVSEFHARLYDPAAEPTAATKAKSEELTASARTEADKIRAIAAFVQQTSYVSVDLNVMHGGGYTPHLADQVLKRNYGDCKDKATLMRALLKSAGINAYAVVIYSGDRDFVRPTWPTPMQFNHAIVAVKVSAETNLPTVLEHPRLGRLLIFDPTDIATPVGGLDDDEQGSLALIIAGPQGDLVKMPVLPASTNRIERTVEGNMAADGSLAAHMTTRYFGQSGSSMRALTRRVDPAELKKWLERSFSHRLGGVSLDKISPVDQAIEGRLDLAIEFGVKQFGQVMQDRLLIVKPGMLALGSQYSFTNKERKLAIKLSATQRKESVVVKAPPGFVVDESPDPVDITSPYGAYHASWKAGGDGVRFEHTLEINDMTAPPSEYSRIREFFDRISAGQASAVVLVRK